MVKFLKDLNNCFYQKQGASFASTRGAPWHGWKRCLEELQTAGAFSERAAYSVLDFACGNRRFEDFLSQSLPKLTIDYHGVDSSDEMMALRQGQNLDLLELLAQGLEQGQPQLSPIKVASCDLSVSFGFMHHIPGQELRAQLLDSMLAHTKPGGHVIVSFWQFLRSPELAAKAEETHGQALAELSAREMDSTPPFDSLDELQAALDTGDYFLGWQGKAGAYRYCHSFLPEEINELADHVADKAQVIARFNADGRTRDLNGYLILKRS